jgi:hypothetical protein
MQVHFGPNTHSFCPFQPKLCQWPPNVKCNAVSVCNKDEIFWDACSVVLLGMATAFFLVSHLQR